MDIEKVKHCHCGNVIFNEEQDFCSALCHDIVTGEISMNQDLSDELLEELEDETPVDDVDINDEEQWKIFIYNFKKSLEN